MFERIFKTNSNLFDNEVTKRNDLFLKSVFHLIRFLFAVLPIEVSQRDREREVREKRQILRDFEFVEQTDEPLVLLAPQRVEVDHQKDSQRILFRIERQDLKQNIPIIQTTM